GGGPGGRAGERRGVSRSPPPGAQEDRQRLEPMNEARDPSTDKPSRAISINRAPVLTLWAAVVAERLGYNADEALTLGKARAGLNVQAKGRRLGIFEAPQKNPHEARATQRGEEFWVELCGRPLPARNTKEGIRAVREAVVIEPDGVLRYLEAKFGADLVAVRVAMVRLAGSYDPTELAPL